MKDFISEIEGSDEFREVTWRERIRPRPAGIAEPSGPLSEKTKLALKAAGIDSLYKHQAEAIDIVRSGENPVVMTPTASGKSLVYNLSVIEDIQSDPDAKALYIFPLKGLIHDQFKGLSELNKSLGLENLCAIYDGDTNSYRRKKIRDNPPSIILTNPDMVHLALNAFHPRWEHFFKNLKYIVIDEIHAYRGVFGSHVAHLLRRLRRIAAHYGAAPRFIACSATIANPLGLANMLTGLDFKLITETGAPTGRKDFIFLDPEKSPYTVATKLFIRAVRAGFKTIAFTKSRKITELMHKWVSDSAPELSPFVSSYRAGFLPEERREIEGRLFSGELKGVISTSALELGVDIGGLDLCILVGYPGSVSSTWQRAGRVGRSGRDSLVIMIALEDALDKYFMRNPDNFFTRSTEAALLDTTNEPIKKAHLLSATSELNLSRNDSVYDLSGEQPELAALEEEGKVRYWTNGQIWYSRRKNPHRHVNIRETGSSYSIMDEDKKLIGKTSQRKVLHELHPGAIYLHRGNQYVVISLHTAKREVTVRPAYVNYYTVPETNEETEILTVEEERRLGPLVIKRGQLRVTELVTGYFIKDIYTREVIKTHFLDLPEEIFTTRGIWFEVPDSLTTEIGDLGFSVPGSLHALEHSLIAALPLFALCDRMDLGGVSYPWNPQLNNAAIFVYDGHEGGIGLTHRGFDTAPNWFGATEKLMADCPCEIACPSCTQDPHCGNANDPLDKRGALHILAQF